MNAQSPCPGAAPVRAMASLEPWEAQFLRLVRLWFDGIHGQEQVWRAMTRTFPPPMAREEMARFERLLRTLNEHAHRTLVHHDVGCRCVGSDEAICCHLVSLASGGRLHEAAQVACLLVTAAHAEPVAILAAHVGTAARRLAAPRSNAPRIATTHGPSGRLH